MSDKMPYYAIDKVAATISIDAKARVKWDKRALAEGVKVTTCIAQFLERVVREDPFTIEDQQKANAYVLKNEENRKARMERKGIKK